MSMIFSDKKIEKLFTLSKIPQRPINVENGDLIFPFSLMTGFVNATEGGYVFNSKVEDYSRFERIFTGYESSLVQWDFSTYSTNKNNNIVKKYQSGNAFLGSAFIPDK